MLFSVRKSALLRMLAQFDQEIASLTALGTLRHDSAELGIIAEELVALREAQFLVEGLLDAIDVDRE